MEMLFGSVSTMGADGEWVSLGAAESCEFVYDDDQPDVLLGWSTRGRCVSFSFPTADMSARTYWLLTRARHPRLRALRRAYRARRR